MFSCFLQLIQHFACFLYICIKIYIFYVLYKKRPCSLKIFKIDAPTPALAPASLFHSPLSTALLWTLVSLAQPGELIKTMDGQCGVV
jgi:hypothetical protein